MLIEKNRELEHLNSLSDTATPDSTSSGPDIAFFSSELDLPVSASATKISSTTPTLLAEVSDLFNKSRERVTRRFKAVSSNKDPNELRKLPIEFSQAILTSQLLVKSLGKTTQCIEKISNLQ